MAHLAHLYGVSEGLHGFIPRAPTTTPQKPTRRPPPPPPTALSCKPKCLAHLPSTPTRRLLLGFASAAFLTLSRGSAVLAEEGNGWWVEGPLQVPRVDNKIANEETGTRSFLKEGVYVADIGTKGRMYRLYKYSFDLMALGDLIGQDTWPYIRRFLRLKATSMYYDFDNVITAAGEADKQPLTDLANKLFNNFEELLVAVKRHDLPKTQSSYQDTTVILKEVMDRMPELRNSS